MCYCKTNARKLSKSIADAQAKLPSLQSTIKEASAWRCRGVLARGRVLSHSAACCHGGRWSTGQVSSLLFYERQLLYHASGSLR